MKNSRGPRRRKTAADGKSTNLLRSDGAHREQPTAKNPTDARADLLRDAPSDVLQLGDPRLMERLGELDDVVFEAIAGKSSAIARLRTLWPEIIAPLSHSLAEESREAYCRHALQKWLDCTENGASRNPKLAVTLMDVLSVLLGDIRRNARA
ncbi:MAG: hypothetical protein JNK76_05525 [Planctomycetales bacterium]|nr:hypothetical protein [Planctomycetales bacterium]MBN8628901.1 hypothetical protein [Planctomycetota bacterium]